MGFSPGEFNAGGIPDAPVDGQMYGRQDAAWQSAIRKAGDTMTGPLVLPPFDPLGPEDAVRKLYVDVMDAALQAQISAIAGGIIYIGAYDVVLDEVDFIPVVGIADGPLPPANTPGIPQGGFVICIDSGTGIGNAPPVALSRGDFLISDGPTGGAAWNVVPVGTANILADHVALSPQVAGWANVQQAVEGLNTGKVARSGDSMTGGLSFGSATAPTPSNLSRHIALWGTTYGFSITGSTLNYEVDSATANHIFRYADNEMARIGGNGITLRVGVGGQRPRIADYNGSNARDIIDTTNGDARYVNQTGDTMTGVLTMANAKIQSRAPGSTGEAPGFSLNEAAGREVARIFGTIANSGLGPETTMYFQTNNGGYGWQGAFSTVVGGPPTFYCSGACSAASYTDRVNFALLQDVTVPESAEFAAAFDALLPRKFRRKPAPPGEGATLPSPVGRWEYGVIAEDVEAGAPDAVVNENGTKGYSITDVLAIAIAKVRELEGRLAALESKA